MRIITFNVNGIRAATKKGFFEWLKHQRADIICLQEIKANLSILEDPIYHPTGYQCYYHPAEKAGYSGVALYCREKPDRVTTRLGWECADQEGRYIQATFGSLTIASLYMPSGSSGEHRQAIKFDFMDHYIHVLRRIQRQKQSFIICGDWNIVHREIDIKNFKGNQKNSGCLPEERAWIDFVFSKVGFVDAFRLLNQKPDQYTWWSHRGQAWAKNVGWRIDYQVITPDLAEKVKAVKIVKDQRFSDHAPLIIDYSL